MSNVNAQDIYITNGNQYQYTDTATSQVYNSYDIPGTSNAFVDDNGTSDRLRYRRIDNDPIDAIGNEQNENYRGMYHAAGLYRRDEIDLFSGRYRFGVVNPYESLGNCKQYLFFTKPDLNIYPRDDDTGIPSSSLHSYLATDSFWTELERKYPQILQNLQLSLNPKDPFNHLLGNMVQSNMEVPSMSADMVETPNNMYGVGYQYRGSSEAGDDSFDFSLEFKDTRYLPVYKYFSAIEEYQKAKHHGRIRPWIPYIEDKILYDQIAVFKFLVDEDGETIVYYGKAYGVKSKNLPREIFSNDTFDNGISYSIDFNAAFYRDKPFVLNEFNNLSRDYYNSLPYEIGIHNTVLDRPDNRVAKAAYVVEEKSSIAPGGKVYKLKWRGDAKV